MDTRYTEYLERLRNAHKQGFKNYAETPMTLDEYMVADARWYTEYYAAWKAAGGPNWAIIQELERLMAV
jgi:hypothetical protein